MALKLERPRKILLAIVDDKTRESLTSAVKKHVDRARFVSANDGTDAMMKINNDPPDIVIADLDLEKQNGLQLTEWVLHEGKFKETTVILHGPLPEREVFVDEIVTGRVQFIDDLKVTEKLAQCLSRALNFIARNEQEQFHLRFLAPGEVLIRQGDEAEFVYIVKRGQLQASALRAGIETALGPVDTGEFVGEMAYIDGEPRNATVTAVTDCELIEIPIRIMDKVLFHRPSWSRALMKTLSKRVKMANRKKAET